MSDAIAEVDLDTIDLQILDVQIEQFESGYKKTSDLVIIELNFQNNGDSFYTLKSPSNQLLLLLVAPYSSSEELKVDTGKNIFGQYEYAASQSLVIKYEELAVMVSECDKVNFSIRQDESKRITICYEIPQIGASMTKERIDKDQHFLRLVTVPFGTSCPNCKMISLKDVVDSSSEEEKQDISKKIPKPELPGKKTYNILVHEMPKQWEKDYANILDDALEFWKDVDPELEFNRVNYWKDADFSVEWASTWGGRLGYYKTCCDDFGLPFVVITLGYFDEENNWIRTEPVYAKELMKHEIGHALDYEHTEDPDDIMFPFAFHEYEKWKELGSETKEFIPTSEQRTEIPAWIRLTASWWAQNLISDNDFVGAMQFLINADIIKIPESMQSASIKEKTVSRSETEHGFLEVEGQEFFLSKPDSSLTVWFSGEYYDYEDIVGTVFVEVVYPSEKIDDYELRLEYSGKFSGGIDISPYGNFEGKYEVKGLKRAKDIGTVEFIVKSGERDKEVIEQEIPSWIKNNADWWSQGLITDDDFVKGIQYLVEQGIIRV